MKRVKVAGFNPHRGPAAGIAMYVIVTIGRMKGLSARATPHRGGKFRYPPLSDLPLTQDYCSSRRFEGTG
jgi:hypothetical protein